MRVTERVGRGGAWRGWIGGWSWVILHPRGVLEQMKPLLEHLISWCSNTWPEEVLERSNTWPEEVLEQVF